MPSDAHFTSDCLQLGPTGAVLLRLPCPSVVSIDYNELALLGTLVHVQNLTTNVPRFVIYFDDRPNRRSAEPLLSLLPEVLDPAAAVLQRQFSWRLC